MSQTGHTLNACTSFIWRKLALLGKPVHASRFYDVEQWNGHDVIRYLVKDVLRDLGLNYAMLGLSILTLIVPLCWIILHRTSGSSCCCFISRDLSQPLRSSQEEEDRRGLHKYKVYIISFAAAVGAIICVVAMYNQNEEEASLRVWESAYHFSALLSIAGYVTLLNGRFSALNEALLLAAEDKLLNLPSYQLLQGEILEARSNVTALMEGFPELSDEIWSGWPGDFVTFAQSHETRRKVLDYSEIAYKIVTALFGVGLAGVVSLCVGHWEILRSRLYSLVVTMYAIGSACAVVLLLAACLPACLLSVVKDGCAAIEPVILHRTNAKWLPIARYVFYGPSSSLEAVLAPFNISTPSTVVQQLLPTQDWMKTLLDDEVQGFSGRYYIPEGTLKELLLKCQINIWGALGEAADFEDSIQFDIIHPYYLAAKEASCCDFSDYVAKMWGLITLCGLLTMLMCWCGWAQLLHMHYPPSDFKCWACFKPESERQPKAPKQLEQAGRGMAVRQNPLASQPAPARQRMDVEAATQWRDASQSATEQQRVVAEQQRQALAAAEQRRLTDQQRQAQAAAEQQRVAAVAEQQRQAQFAAEQRRIAALADQQRQARVAAEQQKAAALAEQQRQAQMAAEQQRQAQIAEQQRQQQWQREQEQQWQEEPATDDEKLPDGRRRGRRSRRSGRRSRRPSHWDMPPEMNYVMKPARVRLGISAIVSQATAVELAMETLARAGLSWRQGQLASVEVVPGPVRGYQIRFTLSSVDDAGELRKRLQLPSVAAAIKGWGYKVTSFLPEIKHRCRKELIAQCHQKLQQLAQQREADPSLDPYFFSADYTKVYHGSSLVHQLHKLHEPRAPTS